MATEARKPMFHLKPADGARGSYVAEAQRTGEGFRRLARALAERVDIKLPQQA